MKEPALEMLLQAKEQRACLPASSFMFLLGILFSLVFGFFFATFSSASQTLTLISVLCYCFSVFFEGISALVALIVVFPHFVSVEKRLLLRRPNLIKFTIMQVSSSQVLLSREKQKASRGPDED